MPVIELHAFRSERNIRQLDIQVKVQFSSSYYHSPKANEKLKELQADLEKVMEKYFDSDYMSDRWLSDHNYNVQKESDW